MQSLKLLHGMKKNGLMSGCVLIQIIRSLAKVSLLYPCLSTKSTIFLTEMKKSLKLANASFLGNEKGFNLCTPSIDPNLSILFDWILSKDIVAE